jgi:hypothetical protein
LISDKKKPTAPHFGASAIRNSNLLSSDQGDSLSPAL